MGTNLLCFFLKRQLEKTLKKHTKTNILLFSADIHTYKLTFVSFFFVFFFEPFPNHLPRGDGEENFSQGVRAGQNIALRLLRTLTPASYEASCSISRSLQNLRGEHPLEGQCRWSLSNSTSARRSLKRRHNDS